MWTKVGCLWHAEVSGTCFPVQYPKAWNTDAKIKSNFLYVMEQTHLIYRMYSVENLSCLFSALRFTLSLMMPWFQSELFMADTSALHGCSSDQRCAHSVVCCRPNSAVTIISVIYFLLVPWGSQISMYLKEFQTAKLRVKTHEKKPSNAYQIQRAESSFSVKLCSSPNK